MHDGRLRLGNGKQTIIALQRLKKEYEEALAAADATAAPAWCTKQLLRVLQGRHKSSFILSAVLCPCDAHYVVTVF